MAIINNKSVLPMLALILSVLALFEARNAAFNIPMMAVSLVGIAAAVLHFMNKPVAPWLLAIWIYGQFPAITAKGELVAENGMITQSIQPILDTGQFFRLRAGFTSSDLNLQVNLVPLFYLGMLRVLRVISLIGALVTIDQFGRHSKLGDAYPMTGIAERDVTLNEEKHWLLVALDTPLTYGGAQYTHLLVRDKEGEIYERGRPGRPSYQLLVPDASILHDGVNRHEDFEFVEWGLVSIAK